MARPPLGPRGEQLAAQYLEAHGWTVLATNYRVGRSEIDLVARRGEVVAFVEVKSRRGAGFGHPLESVTAAKRRRIGGVAEAWVREHGRPGLTYRFDAIAVLWGSGAVIEHVEDAWGI